VGELSGARVRMENDSGTTACSILCCSFFTSRGIPWIPFYSPFAVVLTLTHIYTPFVVLPIYAAMEHVPRNLVEASHDLGASPTQTFGV